MKLLFGCQTQSLDLFHALADAMKRDGEDVTPAFYVAHSLYFAEFGRRHPDIKSRSLCFEWEIVADALKTSADPVTLRRLDELYGDPTCWNTIHSDRRLVFGPHCSLRQDYRRRFEDAQLLSILQTGYEAIEKFVDEVRPDAIITFVCVTFGEYMLHNVAKRRGIPFLNLRTTRIGNFVVYGRSIYEPAETIEERYRANVLTGAETEWTAAADEYISYVRDHHARYEGITVPGVKRSPLGSPLRRMGRLAQSEWAYLTGPARHDNHVTDPLLTWWQSRVAGPRRAKVISRELAPRYLDASHLPQMRYALYPLHSEPEVSLLVYGRPYVNQIEAVRSIARALPVDMPLLVKEHPVALRMRSPGYYRALLEIPNVRLLDPQCPSNVAVKNAGLIVTIGGSMGLEAVLRGRPVVILGRTSYEMLPDTMVRRATFVDLPRTVDELLKTATPDESALRQYVAAVMQESVRANLYSELLSRGGVLSGAGVAGGDETDSVAALAAYTCRVLQGAAAAQSSS